MATEHAAFDKTIYFLGLGGVGKLIAHSFTDIAEPPPITLLFHRNSTRSRFLENGGTIEYIRNGISDLHRGYNADPSRLVIPDNSRPPIQNLIVATKAPYTASALLGVKHRLRSESTIVLLQNGMGLVEELNEKVFPDVETRPYYVLGIVSHGVLNPSEFAVEHTGIGNIALTALPKIPFEGDSDLHSPVTLLAPSTRYILRTLTRTPLLGGIAMSPSALLLIQLEKLASNCVINPLTAILDCLNGELVQPNTSRLVRLLLAEISLVIRAMPELDGIPDLENRFSPARLEHQVKNLATLTARNKSSMLQDIIKGRQTEIDYMNGYIFRRGEHLGIRSMVNYTVKSMVISKSLMSRQGYEKMVPTSDNEVDLETSTWDR